MIFKTVFGAIKKNDATEIPLPFKAVESPPQTKATVAP